MKSEQALYFQSLNIIFNVEEGKITLADKELRLSPVNMKVLQTLLSNAQQVVSRNDLFDAVWGEQQVSDDSLTRCISDIRQQMKKLTTNAVIETIPKKGYRWTAPVKLTDMPVVADLIELNDSQQEKTGVPDNKAQADQKAEQEIDKWYHLDKKSLLIGALVSAIIIVFAFIGLKNRFEYNAIAVLPIETSDTNQVALAEETHELLSNLIIQRKDTQLLASSVSRGIGANRLSLFNEYRAAWVIEGSVRSHKNTQKLTLNLIDPRTALVVSSQSIEIQQGTAQIKDFCQQFLRSNERYW